MIVKRTIWIGVAVAVLGCSSSGPPVIGLGDKGLKDCPDRPNCVSSMAKNERWYVAPFSYAGDREAAFERLTALVSTQRDATIVEVSEDYLHAEFRSRLFRFVDDVEFYLPEDQPVVHVRSASRLGYSDLGVNRKRVERLRTLFAEPVSVD